MGKELSSFLNVRQAHRIEADLRIGYQCRGHGCVGFSILSILDAREDGRVQDSLSVIERAKEALIYSFRAGPGLC